MPRKIFNLSDVETPALKQRGLVNQAFAVGDKMLAPGASETIDDETFARCQANLQDMVTAGLASVDEPTDVYKAAKARAQAADQPASGRETETITSSDVGNVSDVLGSATPETTRRRR